MEQRRRFNEVSEGLLRLLLEGETKEALVDRVVALTKRMQAGPQVDLAPELVRVHQDLRDVHQWAATPLAQVLVPVRGGEFEDVTVARAQLALTYVTECLQKLVVTNPALVDQVGPYVGAMAAALNVARPRAGEGSDG